MVLLTPQLAQVQSKKAIPDGFVGLKWGHSLEKMKEEMLIDRVKVDGKNPNRVMAVIDISKFRPFPDLDISLIGLDFYKDKLYAGIMFLKNYEDWNLLSKTIKEKYGDPSTEEMKNVYGKSIGIILKWEFGVGVGTINAKFNQPKKEGMVHYFFPPKELMNEFSSQDKEERSKVKDKL